MNGNETGSHAGSKPPTSRRPEDSGRRGNVSILREVIMRDAPQLRGGGFNMWQSCGWFAQPSRCLLVCDLSGPIYRA